MDSNGKEDLPFAHRETWSPLQVSIGDEPSSLISSLRAEGALLAA
ncbi:Uncharacterized protein APZ42_024831 [Daphnia magna]|uniref:Uncharacterized protein n=1 Tax=Daphnia magna TaxID=35525 RepID=A0A0N8A5D5_9CRUS|nr:Uncharacterized protein APZ42_024831 [Daphnia magna]